MKKITEVTPAKIVAAIGVLLMIIGIYAPMVTVDSWFESESGSIAMLLSALSPVITAVLFIFVLLNIFFRWTEHKILSLICGIPELLVILFLIWYLGQMFDDADVRCTLGIGFPLFILGYGMTVVSAFIKGREPRGKGQELPGDNAAR